MVYSANRVTAAYPSGIFQTGLISDHAICGGWLQTPLRPHTVRPFRPEFRRIRTCPPPSPFTLKEQSAPSANRISVTEAASIGDRAVLFTRKENPGQMRIFIVDDHALVRDGVRLLVEAQPDMCVIGEAASGRTACESLSDLQPDVVLMDVSMPEQNGIETTARVHQKWPHIKILALTMHEDQSYLMRLLEAGISGYILKRSAGEELIRAIRSVAAGDLYMDPALTATLVKNLSRKTGRSVLPGELATLPLSDRELQVLRLVAEGYTNKEIGVKLQISEKTVETYKTRSMRKLELDSRVDVIRYALQQGWLQQSAV